jgi:hypothetical protein
MTAGEEEDLADCIGEGGTTANLGNPIRVAVRYEQRVLLPAIFLSGENEVLEVTRSTTVISSRIESGALGSVP